MKYIPNGSTKNFSEINKKQNLFLTSGRIGAPEKNNELLLEAFAKIATKCDWNMKFVGGYGRAV